MIRVCSGRSAELADRAWTSGMTSRSATAGGRRRSRAPARPVDVREVALPARQRPRLGFQFPVHALVAAGQDDEPVPLHRRLPCDGLLGLADLLVDALERASGPVGAVLVVDGLILPAGVERRPRLREGQPFRSARCHDTQTPADAISRPSPRWGSRQRGPGYARPRERTPRRDGRPCLERTRHPPNPARRCCHGSAPP